MDARSQPAGELSLSWTIRKAGESDLREVARIERASFSDPWSIGEFTGVLSSPYAIFLVAVDERGRVGGYVVMMAILDESEVLNIAVDVQLRGAAIGARLLDSAIADAELNGARTTFLEVRESNEAALRLYRSRGFEELSRRPGYYRSPVEDALVLRRRSALMM